MASVKLSEVWERVLAPAFLLRLEGGAGLALTILLYRELSASWVLFAALLLVPDLALLGYLGGTRLGARAYNAAHTLVLPAALFAAGFIWERQVLMAVGLVWGAHISGDRLLGLGLKHRPTER